MKKLFSLSILFSLLCVIGCQNQEEIPKNTKQFLQGFYSHDFKFIYDISSTNTLKKIKEIESRIPQSKKDTRVEAPTIVIHEYYEQGDSAYCRYTLKQGDNDTNALSENLLLIKKNNKWLVEY